MGLRIGLIALILPFRFCSCQFFCLFGDKFVSQFNRELRKLQFIGTIGISVRVFIETIEFIILKQRGVVFCGTENRPHCSYSFCYILYLSIFFCLFGDT